MAVSFDRVNRGYGAILTWMSMAERYPRAHWRHVRTTNVVESPFGGAEDAA